MSFGEALAQACLGLVGVVVLGYLIFEVLPIVINWINVTMGGWGLVGTFLLIVVILTARSISRQA